MPADTSPTTNRARASVPAHRQVTVRDATAADAPDCARIYAQHVLDDVATFEEEPPSAPDMAARISASQAAHAWLVALDHKGQVTGYAYAVPFHERAAYRFSCTVSIYLDPNHTGRGIGTVLYRDLLARLTTLGYRMACAGIAVPRPDSEALHARFGFELVGRFRRIGYKHGAWRDVAWYQLPLGDAGDAPPSQLAEPATSQAATPHAAASE